MKKKQILVVDDDPAMRDVIASYLADHIYEISTAATGAETARVIAERPLDLIILDLNLGGEDGLELLRKITAMAVAPVIIITGHRRDEADRVLGLELGADDYLTKPFGLREMLARVRAVLRRSEPTERPTRGRTKRLRYGFAGWVLDMQTRSLAAPGQGKPVKLTAGEFNLLVAFLKHPMQVLSREQLLAASRVHDAEVYDRSIDVLILRLRRKLEPNPTEPQLIKTERGAGYTFSVPVENL